MKARWAAGGGTAAAAAAGNRSAARLMPPAASCCLQAGEAPWPCLPHPLQPLPRFRPLQPSCRQPSCRPPPLPYLLLCRSWLSSASSLLPPLLAAPPVALPAAGAAPRTRPAAPPTPPDKRPTCTRAGTVQGWVTGSIGHMALEPLLPRAQGLAAARRVPTYTAGAERPRGSSDCQVDGTWPGRRGKRGKPHRLSLVPRAPSTCGNSKRANMTARRLAQHEPQASTAGGACAAASGTGRPGGRGQHRAARRAHQ